MKSNQVKTSQTKSNKIVHTHIRDRKWKKKLRSFNHSSCHNKYLNNNRGLRMMMIIMMIMIRKENGE